MPRKTIMAKPIKKRRRLIGIEVVVADVNIPPFCLQELERKIKLLTEREGLDIITMNVGELESL